MVHECGCVMDIFIVHDVAGHFTRGVFTTARKALHCKEKAERDGNKCDILELKTNKEYYRANPVEVSGETV
jgi:hypothetical protein